MSLQILLAFFTYFTILLLIAFNAHKKSQTESDFALGNRSLNFWLTALSAHAADMSAWLFMAVPAAIYLGGMPNAWMAFGLIVGMFLNWHFIAPKLRVQTEKYKSFTLSTFFAKRFEDTSGFLRVLTAFLSLIFLTCYLSAGLIAMGYLFESLFGIDYFIGISFSICVVMAYTFFGGFVTVAWTDLFQGFFLLAMILLVPFVGYYAVGGIEPIQIEAQAKDVSLNLFKDFSFSYFLSILLLAFGWGLGYFGQPHIITKFMGINSVTEMKKAKYLGMSWQILALGGAVFVGLIGIGFFPSGIENDELVFVYMVKDLFHPYFAGLVLCAVLAANISTMDSQILVCATTITEDFYKILFKRNASSKRLLKVSRFAVILVGFISFLLATSKSATVSGTVFYAWSGLGCTFGPLVIASLYFKKVNKYGAIAGLFIGGIIGMTWSYINPYVIDYPIPALVPGFLFAILAIQLVSKIKS